MAEEQTNVFDDEEVGTDNSGAIGDNAASDGVGAAGTADDGDADGADDSGGDGAASGTPPAQVTFSPEALAALKAATTPAAAAAVTPSMTPEQVDELLGRFQLGEDDVEALGLPPAAVARMNDFKAKIVREAVRTAAVHIEGIKRQLSQQITPIQTYMEQARMQQLQTQFYGANKDLVGAEPVVEAVYAQLRNGGVDFAKLEPKAAFDLVAKQARAVKQRMLGGNGQQQPTGKKPAMLSGGRTGGKMAKSSVPESEAQAKAIFD